MSIKEHFSEEKEGLFIIHNAKRLNSSRTAVIAILLYERK